jgi:transposase
MLTWEDDLEVHALRKRGWSIAAIARHTGLDRKTVRKYLAGDGKPGVRARPGRDPFDPFVDYVTARLTEDPHLWGPHALRRDRGAGVRTVVSEPDPQYPGPQSTSGL